jgi:Fe2+ transport system protein FeoA
MALSPPGSPRLGARLFRPEATPRRLGTQLRVNFILRPRLLDLRLPSIPLRQTVELVHIDLPADQAEPLLERGVLPGCKICPVRSSPSGDPIISIDGSLLAIRRETAACLCVRLLSANGVSQLQEAS